MTIADIARAADVPVESVLRVLHHDDVSSDVAARVRDAIDRHRYGRSEWAPDDALGQVRERLDRLAREIDEIKLELRRAQSERLEDLTVVVDLIATSWGAVDRRLAAIDTKLDRLDRPRSRLP